MECGDGGVNEESRLSKGKALEPWTCHRCGWQGKSPLRDRFCPECFSPLWVYEVGHQVGPYELEQILGTGAFAEVWLGVHRDHGYVRALKRIRIEDMLPSWDPQHIQIFQHRFVQEARVQSELHHPHIVQVFDLADWHGEVWMVMEYCGGGNLEDVLRGGRLEIRTALRIIRQLLEGLAYAHSHGVIHRDIKPSNLMKIREGDVWKLGDFGIAKVLSDVETTQTGLRMGTPHYMAPEQWDDPSRVSAASDIYAVGCILYRMIEGRLPFEGDSITEVMRKHLMNEPPPLKYAPSWLAAVVLRALKKDPTRRYRNAEEMIAALASGIRHIHGRTDRRALPDVTFIHRSSRVFGESLITSMAAHEREPRILASLSGPVLEELRLPDLEEECVLEVFDHEMLALAWSWHPDRVLLCHEGRRMIEFDLRRLKVHRQVPLPSTATTMASHLQTRRVLTGHQDGRLILWDARVWTPVYHHRIHRGRVVRVAFNATGSMWASLGERGVLNVGWVQPFEHRYSMTLEDDDPMDFDWHPFAGSMAIATKEGKVILVQGDGGRRIGVFKTRRVPIQAIRFHPQGEYLFGGTDRGEVVIWRVVTGSIADIVTAHDAPVMQITVGGKGEWIITSGLDFSLRVWQMKVDLHGPGALR